MRNINVQLCAAVATLLALSACSNDDDEKRITNDVADGQAGMGSHAGSGASGDGGASGAAGDAPAPPSEEEVCTLSLHDSTPDDVKAVFGEPTSESGSSGDVTLTYEFNDGSAWIFGFDEQGVWNNLSIAGAAVVPGCLAPDGGWYDRPDGGWFDRPDGGWWRR